MPVIIRFRHAFLLLAPEEAGIFSRPPSPSRRVAPVKKTVFDKGSGLLLGSAEAVMARAVKPAMTTGATQFEISTAGAQSPAVGVTVAVAVVGTKPRALAAMAMAMVPEREDFLVVGWVALTEFACLWRWPRRLEGWNEGESKRNDLWRVDRFKAFQGRPRSGHKIAGVVAAVPVIPLEEGDFFFWQRLVFFKSF